MTLHFATARLAYRGADRIDITRSGCVKLLRANKEAPGIIFAPSEELLYPFKAMQANADALTLASQAGASHSLGAILHRATWEAYVELYRAEMRVSVGLPKSRHGALERLAVDRGVRSAATTWKAFLARTDRVTLVCFCSDALRCHRSVIADILQACGACYQGEIGA
jgi:hypothetical protein